MLLFAVTGWRLAPASTCFKRTFGKLLVGALAMLLAGIMVLVIARGQGAAPLSGGYSWPQIALSLANVLLAAGAFQLLGTASFGLGGLLARFTQRVPKLGRPGVVIAIDGPAASGKGTLAKRIAEHFGVPVLDTGLLYRAVARDVLERGGALTDTITAIACANALDPRSFGDAALRGERAGEAASVVARIPEVRAALLAYQRNFAADPRGAVLDGRDIGTVVCPSADVKIYVTATPEERARRRHKELQGRGEAVSFDDVLDDIHRRDARDTGRPIAPLWPAADAITLDTSSLDADQAFAAALGIIRAKLEAREVAGRTQ